MTTVWMLLAYYEGLPLIPVERVREDFFPALAAETFKRKLGNGEIPLPVAHLDDSQKGPKAIPLTDLAAFLDAKAEVGRKEARALRT